MSPSSPVGEGLTDEVEMAKIDHVDAMGGEVNFYMQASTVCAWVLILEITFRVKDSRSTQIVELFVMQRLIFVTI